MLVASQAQHLLDGPPALALLDQEAQGVPEKDGGMKAPLEARWKVDSEEEKSNEEEKPDWLKDLIAAIPDEQRGWMRDYLRRMERFPIVEIPQPPREEILHLVERQKQARADRALKKLLEEERKARVEAERGRKEERNRYWLALAVAIILALVGWAIALGIIQWSPGG